MTRARNAGRLGSVLVAALVAASAGCGGCAAKHETTQTLPPPAPAPSSEDSGKVVQALLDSPWIQNAVDADSEKKPLVLVSAHPFEGAPLKAFGKPVRVLSPAEAQSERPEVFLEIVAMHLEGDRAVVTFRNDSEAVSGEAQLAREQAGWRVAQVTGTQH